MDTPGFGDLDASRKLSFEKALEKSKINWVITTLTLENSKELVDTIKSNKIISKIITDPVQYGLTVMHNVENGNYTTYSANYVKNMGKTKQNWDNAVKKTQDELIKMFNEEKVFIILKINFISK